MKKIVAILSSKRKKNTYSLLIRVLESIPNIEYEIIRLAEYSIKPCLGCENCILKSGCVIQDDTNKILEKMKLADGIILATPVYLRNISGSLKILIDRTCSWYHISEVIGKPILCLCTTASSGYKHVKRILDDLICQWGAKRAGFIYRTVRTMNTEIKIKEISLFINYLYSENINYRPSFKEIKDYTLQKILAKKIITKDKAIWEDKAYYKPPYYFQCRVGPIKRIYGFLFFKLLDIVIPEKT